MTVQSLRHRELDGREIGLSLNAGGIEIGARRKRGIEPLDFFFGDRGEFNLGVERLIQCGMNLETAEPKGMAVGRQQQQGRYEQPANPLHPLSSFCGVRQTGITQLV